MSLPVIYSETEKIMKKTIDKLIADFSAVRTGRPSTALLDPIRVNYYGSPVPIQQVGTMAITEGRTIEIRPWEIAVLPEIEKDILASNLGITPNSDGKTMRLVFPTPTEERRKELVKVVKKIAEDFRVSLRNERRDAIEKLKKEEKDQVITQDLRVQGETKVQGMTNAYIKQVDDFLVSKEKEIMEI